MEKPTGTVTFLFTDIEGSTKLSQEYPESLQESLERHYSIMQEAFETNNGFVFEIVGDAFCCAFQKADEAVKAAVEAQLNLANEKWEGPLIKVRTGIHSGNAEWSNEKYMGYITLARTARIMSAAYGGQIIISNNTYELISKTFRSDESDVNIKDAATLPKLSSDSLRFQDLDINSFRDLGERRLKDVIQPIRLYQLVHPGLREDFPPLKTLDARPNNLPVQLTSFIGREKEIAELKKLLSETRLLTLTGPGGTGKTRLSLQVAAEVIDDFTNGVWITELASLSDPLLVSATIASSLGIPEQPGQETMVTLINYLKQKELLIILDNCEHLIEECAALAEKLLEKCPGIKIIATSREALRSQGENVFRVTSLSHPEPDQKNTPLELSQYEAVRLFIERALAVNSAFRINNNNAPAVAQICFHLDGIPLAIELAAARIKILQVEKICEKLDDRFRLLTGGKRTALPRQQTLKAMIDWSYDMLSENEKLILRRLSVFSGGWTLQAAEEICSGDDVEIYEVMDIHSNLLDKSLISTSESSGSIRFYMLESIKQYASEKNVSDIETAKKHFEYFSRIANQSEIRITGLDQKSWAKLVDTESDNLRTAIKWAMKNQNDEACDLVYHMTDYWDIKGYFVEALQTCIKILNSDMNIEKLSKANILYCAGLMSQNMGNVKEAEIFTKEGLSIFRELDNRAGIGKCASTLGVITSTDPGRGTETREFYDEAISIFRETDMKRDYAVSLYNMSFVYVKEKNTEKALQLRMEALNIYRELNDTHQIALIMSSLGVFELRRKNYDKARSYTEESLAISNETGDKYLISINLVNLGNLYLEQKEYKKAETLLNESLEILNEFGYKSNMIVALMFLGEVAFKTGDNENSVNYHKESVLTGSETGNSYYLATNLFGLGMAYFGLKDYESSVKYFAFVKALTDDGFDPISTAKKEIAEKHRSKLRELLGDEKFTVCMNEALNYTKDEMVRYSVES